MYENLHGMVTKRTDTALNIKYKAELDFSRRNQVMILDDYDNAQMTEGNLENVL